MKVSRLAVRGKVGAVPTLRFEEQTITSYGGLVVFQALLCNLQLKERFRSCFRHLGDSPIYGHHVVALILVVHLLLGYREIRDMRYYQDDEIVKRVIGLRQLPDVATVCRRLATADERSVECVRAENRRLVLDRLATMSLARLTIDFDGSVISTSRRAEGAAVGFNKTKKGRRSYYPLYATVAQTGQVFDFYHRPGNVHDSNGADEFMASVFDAIVERTPKVKLETRMDSAFFSEKIIDRLHKRGVEFTVSVPFERFTELKEIIERRARWRRIDDELSYFECNWKAGSWGKRYRFVFLRKRVRNQKKGPIQLDLFTPYEHGFEFKAIVTNKRTRAKHVVSFHEGRGSQEAIFAELKSNCRMDYVPVKRRPGNQLYCLAAMIAHNLTRELQMQASAPSRKTGAKRAALWPFEKLSTLRRNFIQRAGRLIRPQGSVVLSMPMNPAVEQEMNFYLNALRSPA